MNSTIKKNHNIDPAIIEKFLAVQEQEILMRGKELEIQHQNNNNTHEYAKAALQANKEDRDASRNHEARVIKHRHIYSVIVLVCLIILVGFSLYLNKDQIVMEILKAIILFVSGGLGGYAYAKTKNVTDPS